MIVQRKVIGPVPPVCVNVAPGLEALGLNVPEPPVTTDHAPVALPVGVLPPRPVVEAFTQIVCGPPADAGEGGGVRLTVTSAVDAPHGG